MPKYAVIEDGKVANIIEWAGAGTLGELQLHPLAEDEACDIGWLTEDGQLVAPAPVVPEIAVPTSVTARQARLALLAAGELDNVTDAIAAKPSPQKEAAQIEWEFAATVERDSPLVQMLADELDLDLDALFAAAALL
jgi:hypothetical protein